MYSFGTFAPSTFGEILTRKLNTIGYAKYHIHLHDGVQESRDHAVAVVTTVCQVLKDHQLLSASDILVLPHGTVPREIIQEWKRKLDVYWSGYFFPLLYGIYLRHFKRFIGRE